MNRFYPRISRFLGSFPPFRLAVRFIRKYRQGMEWSLILIEALFMYLVITTLVVQAYVIPSESMEPTLIPGDKVFVNKFVYRFLDPRPGEIAVFRPPDFVVAREPDKKNYIKRVAGLNGQVLRIEPGTAFRPGHGQLTIDGKKPETGTPLDSIQYEWRIGRGHPGSRPVYLEQGFEVPGGEVFFLGDNTTNSSDSRMWRTVPLSHVHGKAIFRFWPPHRIGVLK